MVKSFKLQWPSGFVVSVVLALGACDTAFDNVVAVNRRPSADLVDCQTSSNTTLCFNRCHNASTYSVDGQQCISNSNLFDGKI